MTPFITVKLENREEVTISDPMQLLFPDGLGVPAPSSPSGSPLYLTEDGEDAASIPNALSRGAATLCHRTGAHQFVFAGAEVPAEWPCECGEKNHQP